MYGNINRLKDSFGSKKDLFLQAVTDEQLTDILVTTSDYIDGFLQVRYELPLEVSNPIIDKICIDIAKTETYRLFASNDIPDSVKDKEKHALRDLLRIQKGELLIKPEESNDEDIFSTPQHFDGFIL